MKKMLQKKVGICQKKMELTKILCTFVTDKQTTLHSMQRVHAIDVCGAEYVFNFFAKVPWSIFET